MSYHDKLNIKLNNLQKDFFRLFRKTFPDLADKIEIEKPIIHPYNFFFSIKSVSDIFGSLGFDIGDTEITVFTRFGRRHFPMQKNDEEKNIQKRIQLTCLSVLDYIKDFIHGEIIIEYEQKGDKILKSFQYYKDDPSSPFSWTIALEDEPVKLSLLSKFKNIIRRLARQPIVAKRINWFGDIA